MTEPTFLDLVDRLTRPTPQVIDTDDGLKRVEQDGLLQQLRGAIFSGMEGTGGGSALGSKPPIDAGAADLLNLIDAQAASALRAIDPRPTPLGTTESYVRLWASQGSKATVRVETPATAKDGTVFMERDDVSALDLVQAWVRQIESFFDAPVPVDVLAPCPEDNCGFEFITREVSGVTTHPRAVVLRRDRATGETIDAICRACGREWRHDELPRLAALIGAKPLPEMEANDSGWS